MLPAGVERHDKLLDSGHDGLAGVPRGGGRHQELQQLVGTQEGLPRSHLHLGHPHPRTVHPAQLRHTSLCSFYINIILFAVNFPAQRSALLM